MSPDGEISHGECCWILSLPVISLAALLCCRIFSSSIHPELLKSVVIPSMIVNLGLQLSTAQSHLLVFLAPRSVHPVFSRAFPEPEHDAAVLTRQNLTLKGARGWGDF